MREPTNQNISHDCIVCGDTNPASLHAQFINRPDLGELWCYFEPRPEHQSYPGRVHGGILSAIIDEAIGRTPQIDGGDVWGVTLKLETKFRRPVPYGERLLCRAKLDSMTSRGFSGTATIYGPDGKACVEGKALYATLTASQISPDTDFYDEWIADERELPDDVRG